MLVQSYINSFLPEKLFLHYPMTIPSIFKSEVQIKNIVQILCK